MERIVRVAIYARVSSEQQVEKSGLEVQVAACERYAAEMGYVTHDRYVDEGISGAHTAQHRKALDRLLRDAKDKKFDMVLVHHIDRLARDMNVGLELFVDIAKAGVQLFEVSSRTPYSDHHVLLHILNLFSADDDRKKILQRTKQGHIQRAKQGKVSGPAPLGFDKDKEGRLALNPEEAALVRRIFNLYVHEGHNYDSIAALLNGEGVKTKRARMNEAGKAKFSGNNRWQRSTIQCVLENPVYKGEYIYGKTQGRVPAGKEHQPNPKRPLAKKEIIAAIKNRSILPHEQVVIPVPAIVDVETWKRAEALRSERYKRMAIKDGATKNTYNFTGIVRCAHCERLMTRMTMEQPRRDGSKRRTAYYTCRNAENQCPSAHKHHRMDKIDAEIMGRLIPYLENPERIREGLATGQKEKQQKHDSLMESRRAKEKRMVEIGTELQRLIDGHLAGAFTIDQFMAEKQKREQEQESLRQELASIDEKIAELGVEEDRENVGLVVACLSQPAFRLNEPWLALQAIFPNRRAVEGLSKQLTVKEALQLAPAIPSPADDDWEIGRQFLTIVQTLVKRVMVDDEGRIVDYKLRISTSPLPEGSSSGEEENHIANLKCMTSPSFTS